LSISTLDILGYRFDSRIILHIKGFGQFSQLKILSMMSVLKRISMRGLHLVIFNMRFKIRIYFFWGLVNKTF